MNNNTLCLSNMEENERQHGGQGLPAPVCSPASVCECQSWCQTRGKIIASHHRNCRHYDLEGDCHKLITELLRGIEASAADTDGIHPALWEAYKRAKASVWEFDWKEENDPRPLQYTGHVPCRKCGQTHWMHGPCPENAQADL